MTKPQQRKNCENGEVQVEREITKIKFVDVRFKR